MLPLGRGGLRDVGNALTDDLQGGHDCKRSLVAPHWLMAGEDRVIVRRGQ